MASGYGILQPHVVTPLPALADYPLAALERVYRVNVIAPLALAACGLLLAVLTSYYARGIEVS